MNTGIQKKKTYCFVLGVLTGLAGVGVSPLGTHSAEAATENTWSRPSWQRGGSAPTYSSIQRQRRRKPIPEKQVTPYSPGSNNLAIDVGQTFLMGDLSSNYEDSIGIQAHYTYGVSEMFGFDASFGYSNHGDASGAESLEYSVTTLLAGLRTNLSWFDKVVPYIVFGLGFYKPSYSFANPGSTDTSSVSPLLFGLHLGPGVDLVLNDRFFFGAALTFHDIFGTTKTHPLTGKLFDVGGTYTSFLLHTGMTF